MKSGWGRIAPIIALVLSGTACDSSDGDRPSGATFAPLERDRLQALGYVDWHDAEQPSKQRVTVDRSPERDALYLYSSRPKASAHLLTITGELVHSWAYESKAWQHVEMGTDGELFALVKDRELLKLDWNSNLLWSVSHRVHHDLAIASDGRLLLLARRGRKVGFQSQSIPILDDLIVEVSPEGAILREWSIYDLFKDYVREDRLRAIASAIATGKMDPDAEPDKKSPSDLFHTNSIEWIRWEGHSPESVVLLSIRNLGRVAAVQLDPPEVLWVWGDGILDQQHDAKQLENGAILVFDNGVSQKASRILEIEPERGTFRVLYEAPGFFSRRRGGVERTPGGNLLITDSQHGRVIEANLEGDIVWEFWNPDVQVDPDDGKTKRAAIYRMSRVKREGLAPVAGLPVGD